jgi:ADP-ribose pyrophosphatase YjhB (NUDIX family)
MTKPAFPTPIVTADLAIFALLDGALHVLLIKRREPPFSGAWALPGGFIHVDEDADIEAAARRILQAKTGIAAPYLEQVQSFGSTTRDPRGWSVSIAYMALISADFVQLVSGANAADVQWRPISLDSMAANLAFDHGTILTAALQRLQNKVKYSTLPVHLLPAKFTLPDLQDIYERILNRKMDKSAFRKRIAEAEFLEPIPGEKRPASNRPAQIYRLRDGFATIFFDRTI